MKPPLLIGNSCELSVKTSQFGVTAPTPDTGSSLVWGRFGFKSGVQASDRRSGPEGPRCGSTAVTMADINHGIDLTTPGGAGKELVAPDFELPTLPHEGNILSHQATQWIEEAEAILRGKGMLEHGGIQRRLSAYR